jgi:AbrB family transcriptional regulator (stage V sporulation protein T)
MNNFSFIKRIDDLGRIVIPKEIRRKLKIEEHENMEISIKNDEIVLNKHSLLNEKENKIINIGKVIYELVNKNIIITNREKIIYSNDKSLIDKEISDNLKEYIIKRYEINGNKKIEIIKNINVSSNFISKNIIIDSDASGIIIIYSDEITEKDKLVLDIVSELLNKSV